MLPVKQQWPLPRPLFWPSRPLPEWHCGWHSAGCTLCGRESGEGGGEERVKEGRKSVIVVVAAGNGRGPLPVAAVPTLTDASWLHSSPFSRLPVLLESPAALHGTLEWQLAVY